MPMPRPGTDFDPDTDLVAPGDHPMLARLGAAAALWGFDWTWYDDTPAELIATLRANSAQFAGRYVNDAVAGGKGIRQAEAAALTAAGIIIVPCYETTGTDFTGGYQAGQAAGGRAAAQLAALGAPAGTYCWFAIDTGTTSTAATNDYLRGCKAGTGPYIAQLYGSYTVVEAAYAAGLGDKHWQTYAWSAGKLSSRAAIYQYQNGVTIGGIDMDRDRTLQAMSGPWARFGAAPDTQAPAFPYPAGDYLGMPSSDSHCHSGFFPADVPNVRTWQAQMARRGWPITADGQFGSQSDHVARTFQLEKGLTVDGKVGPATWKASWASPVT